MLPARATPKILSCHQNFPLVCGIVQNEFRLRLVFIVIMISPIAKKIFQAAEKDPCAELNVNLEEQTITLLATGEKEHFDINVYKKTCLLNGYDDIDYLLSIRNEIEEFETHRSS